MIQTTIPLLVLFFHIIIQGLVSICLGFGFKLIVHCRLNMVIVAIFMSYTWGKHLSAWDISGSFDLQLCFTNGDLFGFSVGTEISNFSASAFIDLFLTCCTNICLDCVTCCFYHIYVSYSIHAHKQYDLVSLYFHVKLLFFFLEFYCNLWFCTSICLNCVT